MQSTSQDILLGGFINAWDSTNTVNIFKCIISIHCLITGWFINACVFFNFKHISLLMGKQIKKGKWARLIKNL